MCGRLRQVAVLGLVWLLCLAITLGCTVAVYAFSELMIQVGAGSGRPRELWAGGQTPASLGMGPR